MEQDKYLRASDFSVVAEDVTISRDVRARLREERERFDSYALRANQDWSYLNSQVVGAETGR